MKYRSPYHLPTAQKEKIAEARRWEWITIFFLLTIAVVMYVTMGSSQAMKTAWVEDIWSLIPPIVFLTAMYIQDKAPDESYPYGFRSIAAIAFLSAATAVLLLGLYMLYDAATALMQAEHPTIGMIELFGRQFWSGWLMIAALIYSAIPPFILGRRKLSLADELHDKTLHADAAMNKADWSTAVAAMIGILGVGLGWWWADALAAGVIALDITRDGVTNVRQALTDLLNQQPTTVDDGAPDPLTDELRERLCQVGWVKAVDVRLREEGQVLAGEIFVVPKDETDLVAKLAALKERALDSHWRIYDVVVTAVSSLD